MRTHSTCPVHFPMRILLPGLMAVATAVGACVHVPPASEPGFRATYRCESGRRIQAWYPSDGAAVVVHGGRTLRMTLAVSASGARYVGGGLEWWTKGSGPGSPGTLFRHLSDSTSGEAVEQCEQE